MHAHIKHVFYIIILHDYFLDLNYRSTRRSALGAFVRTHIDKPTVVGERFAKEHFNTQLGGAGLNIYT